MDRSAVLYYTLAGEFRNELIVKGSRFIATAVSVASKEDALMHVERVRQLFPDATHHCYAYRLGAQGLEFRDWDDGEPRGVAGKPILFVLQKYRLSDTVVVVTRYVEGTKLGRSSLARVYGQAAEKVLSQAQRIPVVQSVHVRVFCDYRDVDTVLHLLRSYALSFESEYRDAVELDARIRHDVFERFAVELAHLTAARAGFIVLSEP